MRRLALHFVCSPGLLALILTGCHAAYSPNTYASDAAQQEASVQRGMIIGVRQVMISANGTVGAVTGGAAGGVAGAQVPGGPVGTALGAIGGTLVGGIGGTVAAQAVADTKGWEYIVQESADKLVSVTQTSKTPLPIGLHVLVISDAQQARIVPDYTVEIAAASLAANPAGTGSTRIAAASEGATSIEIHIDPLLPPAGAQETLQAAPTAEMSVPATPSAPASTAGGAMPRPAKEGASSTGTLVATPVPGQAAPAVPLATPPLTSPTAAMP